MTTNDELYSAHTGNDPFDTQLAILHLDQATKWLVEASLLAKEGTIDALLKYFQVGYTSGNWHFPTIATHYAHGIGHRMAKMLEDELLRGTGFHFRYRNNSPQNFTLYYREEAEEGEKLVAVVSIWTRKIKVSVNFKEEYLRIKRLIGIREQEVVKRRTWIEKNSMWFEQQKKKFWFKRFKKRKLNEYQRVIDWQTNLANISEEDATRFAQDIEQLKLLESKMGILHRFERYGFSIQLPEESTDEESIGNAKGSDN